LILLLALEFIVFRIILPASDWPYRRTITPQDNVVRYLYKDAPMYATGISRIGFPERYAARYTINHEGWNSTKEYFTAKKSKKRIAVIGDSFVDALQVNVDKCFAELLERELNERNNQQPVEVYRFGFGNSGFSQYLNVLRYVKKKFNPDLIIISIQANDFYTSLYGNWSNQDGDFLQFIHKGDEWEEVQPVPYQSSKLRLFLKRSAIFRYLYGNLEFRYRTYSLGDLWRHKDERKYQMNVDIAKDLYQMDLNRSLSSHILKEMKNALGPETKLLLFMDADRDGLYHGYDLKKEKSYQLIAMTREVCESQSVPFIDLTDAFTNDYKKYHQRFDYDIDRHWNERGHAIVAHTLANFLEEWERRL